MRKVFFIQRWSHLGTMSCELREEELSRCFTFCNNWNGIKIHRITASFWLSFIWLTFFLLDIIHHESERHRPFVCASMIRNFEYINLVIVFELLQTPLRDKRKYNKKLKWWWSKKTRRRAANCRRYKGLWCNPRQIEKLKFEIYSRKMVRFHSPDRR